MIKYRECSALWATAPSLQSMYKYVYVLFTGRAHRVFILCTMVKAKTYDVHKRPGFSVQTCFSFGLLIFSDPARSPTQHNQANRVGLS